MKYVGEALLGEDGRPVTAVIGVATWGIVSERALLEETNGKYVDYPNPDSLPKAQRTSALDRNHTHFILVDNGSVGKFGVEV
jgi:transient receptor potential cation channel subfamily M protein 2